MCWSVCGNGKVEERGRDGERGEKEGKREEKAEEKMRRGRHGVRVGM